MRIASVCFRDEDKTLDRPEERPKENEGVDPIRVTTTHAQ